MSALPKYYFTDVFGQTKYSGNQLATFRNCSGLTDDEMQQIACEINFSETTFIMSDEPKNGGYDVRIFTPGAEIDFAGHPTLGTAWIIQKHIIQQPVEKVVLNLKVGQVPVQFPASGTAEEILWMKQVEPQFGNALPARDLAPVLSLSEEDFDERWPIQEVSTGLHHIIVPVKDLGALQRVKISLPRYYELIKKTWAKVVLVFCPQGYTDEQSLSVRVFPITFGIAEDPATGSGNGCLGAYLIKQRYFGTTAIDIKTGQGYEIGRPAQLYIRADEQGGKIDVQVGGQVVPVARGDWG